MTFPARFTSAIQVVQAIRNGAACAVLVEGEEQASDAWILSYLLKSRVGQTVTFHGRDGRTKLLAELPGIVEMLPAGKVAAIVDRDFAEPDLVERTYASEYAGHLFYWRRSCLENYLLEPSWLTEVIEEFYLHQPARIPPTLRTAQAVEHFLLDWSRRLTAQVAGNWVVAHITQVAITQDLSIAARPYFDDLIERDPHWVLTQLLQHYGGWSNVYPELLGAEALTKHFEARLAEVQGKMQSLNSAHEVVSGKTLLKAVYAALPGGPKPAKEHVRNRLVRLASRQVPDDVRFIVEERILPRWRQAQAANQQ